MIGVPPVDNNPETIQVGFNASLSEEWKGRYSNFEDFYSIHEENGKSVLSASSRDSDCFIAKRIEVDIVQYPYLNWSWRANALPKNGDESKKANCDVAASIAVVLNKSKILPKSIKYSWSSTLPSGTITESPFAFWPARCDVVVMESGETNKGQWVQEKVNVLEHYKTFYEKKKVKSKKVSVIVIMTDSDSTNSLSEADYSNIFFSKT